MRTCGNGFCTRLKGWDSMLLRFSRSMLIKRFQMPRPDGKLDYTGTMVLQIRWRSTPTFADRRSFGLFGGNMHQRFMQQRCYINRLTDFTLLLRCVVFKLLRTRHSMKNRCFPLGLRGFSSCSMRSQSGWDKCRQV